MEYRIEAKREWPLIVFVLLDLAFGFWVWPKLPARVPTHWGLGGVNRFGPSYMGALLLPVINCVVYVYHLFGPKFSPKLADYAKNPRFYRGYRWLAAVVVGMAHVGIVFVTLKYYA